MNNPIKNGTLATVVSRRGFVKGAAGLSFAFALGGALLGTPSEAYAADGAKLNAWVTIGADNTITILCPTSEMGQGVLTALPLILAEELDADWSKVKCEFAPGNPKLFGGAHKMFPGAQVTLASVSVPAYFMPLRLRGRAGPQGAARQRRRRVEGAGRGTDHRARARSIHAKSKRRISYGDVVKFAKVPAELPKIAEGDLKKPSAVQADRAQGHRAASTCRRRSTARPNTASTCRCRAWSTPRCCTRRWTARRPRASTPTTSRRSRA